LRKTLQIEEEPLSCSLTVDMAAIALWLGHESLETTHVYVEADLATKERAFEKLAPTPGMPAHYRAADKLLAFPAAL
jgi:hypothetical protein